MRLLEPRGTLAQVGNILRWWSCGLPSRSDTAPWRHLVGGRDTSAPRERDSDQGDRHEPDSALRSP